MNEKRAKYNAKPVKIDGIRFDSQLEVNRYSELKVLENAGEIKHLVIHPNYELQPAFRKNGKTYRAIHYEGDFQYQDVQTGGLVIEEVKGFETATFKLKMKMFLYQYPGVDFRIVR